MRFKGWMPESDSLLRVTTIMARAQKACVLKITRTEWTMVINNDADGVSIWAGFPMDRLFENAEVESANDNHIGLSLQLDQFERAIRSIALADRASFKLAKHGSLPFLEVTGVVRQGAAQIETNIAQRVPVVILPPQQLAMYTEPVSGTPDVYIQLPKPLTTLRNIVERLRNVSDHLRVIADMQGKLRFEVSTDVAEVAVEFNDLPYPTLQNNSEPVPSADARAECTVDIKNFAKVMQTSLLNPRGVILCLENNQKCTVYKIGDANDAAWITFHLPVLYT